MKLNVFLLKSIDENDKYIDYLSSSRSINEIKVINLLEFKFINLKLFEKKLNDFLNKRLYSCLILTSRQIVEAMKLIELKIESKEDKFIIYCVGEQTAQTFRNYLLDKHQSQYFDIRIPLVKQNANELANLIINENEGPFNALYPCSSIRKDDLIVKLTDANLSIDELKVYETIASENGIKSLFLIDYTIKQNCFVFFSPSCVQSVLENEQLREKFSNNIIISIGPSTSHKLKSFLKNINFIEMTEPSPKGLADSLDEIFNKNI
jgi:uroporphyrinogen-III synthase